MTGTVIAVRRGSIRCSEMALHRIKKARIRRLALVRSPANRSTWHLLKTGEQLSGLIAPRRPDWQTAYVVVAAPGRVEGGGIDPSGQLVKGPDGEPIEDVWDEAAIADAAHSWSAGGGLLSDAHFTQGGSAHARWSESFIAPVDYDVDGVQIPAGSWVVGITPTTEEGRRAIESGDVAGVSVEGSGEREPVLAKANDGLDGLTPALAEELLQAIDDAPALARLSPEEAAENERLVQRFDQAAVERAQNPSRDMTGRTYGEQVGHLPPVSSGRAALAVLALRHADPGANRPMWRL